MAVHTVADALRLQSMTNVIKLFPGIENQRDIPVQGFRPKDVEVVVVGAMPGRD